jgi:predicted negative regulator of RcsB-dependent stress response
MAYESEQEQVEALKQWWRDNGTALMLGLALGLAALFGWRYWSDQQNARAEQASITYELLLNALQNNRVEEAIEVGERIMADHENSAYAVLSALLLGRLGVERENFADAKGKLEWAKQHADTPALKQIASERIARILLYEGQPDQAWNELSAAGVTGAEGFYEVKADILAAQGKIDEAREMYGKAIREAQESSLDARALQLKHDNLAPSAPPAASQ